MDDRAKMIEKVKKVLAIAKNTKFEEEAQNAFAMAQKLMAQYKLTELEVEGAAAETGFTITVTKWRVDTLTKGTPWKQNLAYHIARNFRCMAYQRTNWDSKKDERTLMFLGSELDVEMATEIYRIAVDTIEKRAKKFRAQRREELRQEGQYFGKEGSRASCLSWINGFVDGIRDAFERSKAEMMKENEKYALVLALPSEVEAEARKMGLIYDPPTPEQLARWEAQRKAQEEADRKAGKKPHKPKMPKVKKSEYFDHSAYYRGREEGKNFDVTVKTKIED